MSHTKELITINAWIVDDTKEKAIRLKDAPGKIDWFPRSQIHDQKAIPDKPGKYSFKAPEWILEDKGWI